MPVRPHSGTKGRQRIRKTGAADMTQRDDRTYFAARAAKEHEMASRCDDAAIAATHRQLAEAYEQRLGGMSADVRTVPDARASRPTGDNEIMAA
jgi:hypothetical protein